MSAITSGTNNFLVDLPEEATLNILSHLDMQELGRFSLVSRQANRLSSDDELWQRLVSGPANGIKAYFNSHAVRSVEEVALYIQVFIENIQLNKKGIFICEFPFNPEFHISIGYKSGVIDRDIVDISKEIASDPDFQLVCYFMAQETGEPELGLDVQGGPSESFIVTTKLRLHKNQIPNMELAGQICRNVRARLEYLKGRSMFNRVIDALDAINYDPRFDDISRAITVTSIALAVLVLGITLARGR